MKIRTLRHIVKEGFGNAYRNKLMSLASISIVTASIMVFGLFYLITVNIGDNGKVILDQPEMEVFCDSNLDNTQIAAIEQQIQQDGDIKEYHKISKEQAFEEAKDILGDYENLLEGEDPNFLPISFVIKLKDSQKSDAIVAKYREIPGVENVTYSKETVSLINRITYWLRFISLLLTGMLLVISVFIISNTIKLTVFARRKEINIMKYIGGTDWFIRWPFLIEGVIIGFTGAMLSFVLISYGYNALEARMNADLAKNGIDFVKLLNISQLWQNLLGMSLVFGCIIGIVGSGMSIRKYLRV